MNNNEPPLSLALWEAIAVVRDQYPRNIDDADTDDVVDAILPIVRKAQAEALRGYADAASAVPDYAPTDYDRGRVDQRHMMAEEVYRRADTIEKESS